METQQTARILEATLGEYEVAEGVAPPPTLIPQAQAVCARHGCQTQLGSTYQSRRDGSGANNGPYVQDVPCGGGWVDCPVCKGVRYCSTACGVRDAEAHAGACAQLRVSRASSRAMPQPCLAYTVGLDTARRAVQDGDPSKALALLGPMAKVYPDAPGVMVVYAQALDAMGRFEDGLGLLRGLADLEGVDGNSLGALAQFVHRASKDDNVPHAERMELQIEAKTVYDAARMSGVPPMDDPGFVLDLLELLATRARVISTSVAKADLYYDAVMVAAETLASDAINGGAYSDIVPTLHCAYASALIEYDAFRSTMLMPAKTNDVTPAGAGAGDAASASGGLVVSESYLATRRERERAEKLRWATATSVFDAVIPHYEAVMEAEPEGFPGHGECCGLGLLRAYGKAQKYSKGLALARKLLETSLEAESAELHTYTAHIVVAGFADVAAAEAHHKRALELATPEFVVRATFAYAQFAAERNSDPATARTLYARVLSLPNVAPSDPHIKVQVRQVELPELRTRLAVSNAGDTPLQSGIGHDELAGEPSSAAGVAL